MPSLREEITKTFLRLSRRGGSRHSTGESETLAQTGRRVGQQFGAYRILSRLGVGGMGEVYLAQDTRLGRYVALKFLPREFAADQVMLRRLQQEARAASALNHPNILTIYEIGEIDGEQFIASEYIDGETLRNAMRRGSIEPRAAIEIASQVASALMAAHSAGVVHRDLKPGNIMIRPDGYVKIIDFGLAKHVAASDQGRSDGASWTRPGTVMGTLDYMSPEQARGEDLDSRTDLWSLGVILYEMIARNRPFSGQTDSHVIVAILDNPLPPLPEEAPLPAGLSAVIQRALAKDRAKRYQSAREMLTDLRQVGGASGTNSIRPIALPARPKFGRNLVFSGTIVALLIVAFAVWWWALNGRDLVLGPSWFRFQSTTRVTYDGDVHLASISPDGAYLAYVSGHQASEQLRIHRIKSDSETGAPIAVHRCIGLTFSPDSKSLYYVLKDPKEVVGRLYAIQIPQSIPSLVLEDIDGPITFSPDGQQFAYLRRSEEKGASGDSIIVAQASSSRDGRPIVTISNTEVKDQLAWSPRGDSIGAIVFAGQLSQATQPAVSLFTLDGHLKRRFSAPGFRTLAFPVWLDRGSLLLFSGLPQSSKQFRLAQLSISTGHVHEVPSDILGFDSITATADGQTLAAVRLDLRSSIWVAGPTNLNDQRRILPATEGIDSLAWLNDASLVFPAARSGDVNLWRAEVDGSIHSIPGGKRCVEDQPSAVPAGSEVIYSSNCGAGGDDFNLWSADLLTGRRKQLTSGSNYDYQPDVSRDGKWIVYTSWPSSVPSIWKIPMKSGAAPVRVSRQQARFPAISPSGTEIACQIREPDGLWRVAILSIEDGTVLKEFPQLPITGPARWSPDGSALDYLDSRGGVSNVWRQFLSGGAPRQLTNLSEDGVIDFAWSQNGSKLAYIRGRAESDAVLFYRSSRP
ncbi:MAG: protein kinase [Bryobacteraceae bacterium]